MKRSIILISLVASASCSSQGAGPESAAPAAVAVDLVRVTFQDSADRFEAGGVVRARTTAALTSRILAPVREVRVSAGDRVRAGQTLVVLDARDLSASARAADGQARGAVQAAAAARADLQGAEAAFDLAKATHARISMLHGRKSATAQELDEATAALRGAESRIAAARARAQQAADAVAQASAGREAAATTASFAVIAAPFAGTVTETLIDPGNMAAPGVPLVRIDAADAFQLEVLVDESRARYIARGAEVPVSLDSGAESLTITGRVDEIARAVDADARAFVVKIALPSTGSIVSGRFGRAIFTGPPRRGLFVPETSVVRRGQVTSVFVADNGIARVRLVSMRDGEVVAGLSEGETVVVSPPPGLMDGRPVSGRSR